MKLLLCNQGLKPLSVLLVRVYVSLTLTHTHIHARTHARTHAHSLTHTIQFQRKNKNRKETVHDYSWRAVHLLQLIKLPNKKQQQNKTNKFTGIHSEEEIIFVLLVSSVEGDDDIELLTSSEDGLSLVSLGALVLQRVVHEGIASDEEVEVFHGQLLQLLHLFLWESLLFCQK